MGPKIIPQGQWVDTADEWVENPTWVSVYSSNVSAIRYEKNIRRLLVRFGDGSLYKYDQVGPTIAANMYNCTSMGKFVWWLRRNGYKGVKI